jgi:hypothetical protein
MKQLSNESRKRLTMYLGECYHEEDVAKTMELIRDPRHRSIWFICNNCEHTCLRSGSGHSFTTYNDLGALKDRLCEKGEWDDFVNYSFRKWADNVQTMTRPGEYEEWLFRPESCRLVDEYLLSKEGRV